MSSMPLVRCGAACGFALLSRSVLPLVLAPLLLAAVAPPASAGLGLLGQFHPGVGSLVSAAFDQANGTVWVHGTFAADVRQYTLAGAFVSSVPRPGESADDIDLEIAPEALLLAGTPVPAGTLLVINGESGAADIYAVDKGTGAVLATLHTAFGTSHVVGGAYHAARGTFFLVQDRVPPAAADQSLVAEVDALTGAVLGSFKTDVSLPGFTVFFGDLDVSAATGNLRVVSSDESALAEFTPTGTLVQQHALPAGVASLSGLGLDDAGGGAWVSESGGAVLHLGGFAWSSLGGALAGSAGTPVLTGSGTLVAGSPTTLAVQHGKPSTTSWIVVGFAQLGLPFKGGTMVPDPVVVVGGIPIDAGGTATLAFPWPAAIPSGFPLYHQFWMADSAGPAGFSATNGLRALSP